MTTRDLQTVDEGKTPDVYRPPHAQIQLPPPPKLRHELRRPARLGIAIVIAFFGVGGAWSATAPISGATIAAGIVSPEGSRQTVQHLEGGIIRQFHVREGDVVAAGDVLVTLADTKPLADVETLTGRLRTFAAVEARLEAERRGAAEISFDHPTLADRSNPEVQAIIQQQTNSFETRAASDKNRREILLQKIAQLEQQNIGAQRQIESVRRQYALIREELIAKKELYEKGFETKPKLLQLQRQEADLLGDEGDLLSRIARNDEAIGETKLQIINTRIQRMEDIDKELSDIKAKRAEVEKQIRDSEDRLARTLIKAPVSGVVLDLRFKTPGAVVRAGEAVLDIVPSDMPLIIDAKVSPRDIDDVRPKLPAYVMFPSYPQRSMIRADGRVKHVSADAFADERTGERYYRVKVEVDRAHLKELDPDIELTPGMPAEIFIATIDRTLLDYLLQPFLSVVEHSFREH